MKTVLLAIFMLNGNPAGQLDPVVFDDMARCVEVYESQKQTLVPSKGEEGARQSFRVVCINDKEVKVLQ